MNISAFPVSHDMKPFISPSPNNNIISPSPNNTPSNTEINYSNDTEYNKSFLYDLCLIILIITITVGFILYKKK